MTKRFKITQNGDLFTVRDTVENKPMGVFEFKENEFPVYFCFHKIIDLMNELSGENEQLKKDVEYWKQVASQYSNELNVFEHCKKYKTECKDIYWSSD